MIVFDHVAYDIGGQTILDDVTFTLTPGDACCILGRNGSGKTMICHLLLRILRPTRGNITVDDADLAALPPAILRLYRRSIGFLAEDDGLRPQDTMTAAITEALRLHGVERSAMTARSAALFTQVGLREDVDAPVAALTRPQRRRLALARAIAGSPKILLLDEPAAAIDREGVMELRSLIRARHREGTTVIVMTASSAFAEKLGFRILVLEGGRLAAHRHLPLRESREHREVAPEHARITPTSA